MRAPLLDVTGVTLSAVSGVQSSGASLSPDAHWVAFTVGRPDGMAALYLAPAGQQLAPRDSWTQIAEDHNMISRPVWSPDGHLIYYESTRDNHICLWAQRIGAAGQPTGAPISAAHFHHSVESLLGAGVPFGITRDTLYVLLAEVKGNVWMVKVGRP